MTDNPAHPRGRGRGRGGRGRGRGRRGGGNLYPDRDPPAIDTMILADDPMDDEPIPEQDPRRYMVDAFVDYFEGLADSILASAAKSCSCAVNFSELQAALRERTGMEGLNVRLQDEPSVVLQCLRVALKETLQERIDTPPQGAAVRIVGFGPVTQLRDLKSHVIGKFVAIHGTVVRASTIRPLCRAMEFECSKCETRQEIRFRDGKFRAPSVCNGARCSSKAFNPLRSDARTVDWQQIRVQEIVDGDVDQGRVPRTVEVELTDDLVDMCIPGDIITVCGVVKAVAADSDFSRKNKMLFLLYVDGNSVVNSKESNEAEDDDKCPFTETDLRGIIEISSHTNPPSFPLVANSLSPGIYGHEMVKAGLALALFGGVSKFSGEESHDNITIRGDPHVLVVGDPGLGKSQMLQGAAAAAPRGVYVCGNTTTASGLTVTVVKDSATGDYALEAGALVLADQGVCCIDEFDKMGSEHHALLEAMEQQSISVAKAGIVCNLPARASVIAAANPAAGHYNRGKTVAENLKMGPTLLSRFDLIFILLDKPDLELDQRLSEHVMALHAGGEPTRAAAVQTSGPIAAKWSDTTAPLTDRLKVNVGQFDPIPAALLRKYIAYARKYVHPRMSSEASAVIQQFYLSLRRTNRGGDATPVTTRQLESLIRLSEARAKVELMEIVTEKHAQEVVELFRDSLIDVCTDEFGNIDYNRAGGMSKAKETRRFVGLLHSMAEQTYNNLFTVDEMRDVAQKNGINVDDFSEFLEHLNTHGYIIRRSARVYKLQTAQMSQSTTQR